MKYHVMGHGHKVGGVKAIPLAGDICQVGVISVMQAHWHVFIVHETPCDGIVGHSYYLWLVCIVPETPCYQFNG